MTKLIDLLDQLKHRRTFGFMDDFDSYTDAERWTKVLAGSGTVDVADGPSGILWGHLWTTGAPSDAYGPLPW